MKVSKAAFLAALTVSGSAIVSASPASAQRRPAAPAAAQPGAAREPVYSREERAALAPLQQAYQTANTARQAGQTADWTPVEAALPAAQAAAQGNDARSLVSRIQLGLADAKGNNAMMIQALDALIANPLTTPTELPVMLRTRVVKAFDAQDFATAERHLVRLQQLVPNDPSITSDLAVVRRRMGNTGGALEALMQNIQAEETANQRAGEDLYRRAFAVARETGDRGRTFDLALRLARNYPTSANWRNAVAVSERAGALELDLLRFARASGSLEGRNDYLAYAQVADQAALSGEAKAVIEEGIARQALQAGDSSIRQILATATTRSAQDRTGLTAEIGQARSSADGRLARNVGDALFGYGRYAEAADLYRVAAGKPGADANLLNLRLGYALALAGQRAEAETALRATGGSASDLAKLWLAWLGRRPA